MGFGGAWLGPVLTFHTQRTITRVPQIMFKKRFGDWEQLHVFFMCFLSLKLRVCFSCKLSTNSIFVMLRQGGKFIKWYFEPVECWRGECGRLPPIMNERQIKHFMKGTHCSLFHLLIPFVDTENYSVCLLGGIVSSTHREREVGERKTDVVAKSYTYSLRLKPVFGHYISKKI